MAVLLTGAAVLLPVGAAGAQEESPAGTFSSPTRAVAGQPIFVRSITPCPMNDGAYEYVSVFIHDQDKPHLADEIDATSADLAPNGSWTLTINVPEDMPTGITKSYSVHAQCREDPLQYWDPLTTPPEGDPRISNFRYFLRPLYVTGFGAPDAVADGDSADESTTTTSSTSTTSTSAPVTPTTPTTASAGLSAQSVDDDATWVSDEKERAADARRELARQSSTKERDVTLSATPVGSTSPPPPSDGGAPWWSFVAATMLAVGAVVGYGARRSSAG